VKQPNRNPVPHERHFSRPIARLRRSLTYCSNWEPGIEIKLVIWLTELILEPVIFLAVRGTYRHCSSARSTPSTATSPTI
jgi:hypothetical protein